MNDKARLEKEFRSIEVISIAIQTADSKDRQLFTIKSSSYESLVKYAYHRIHFWRYGTEINGMKTTIS